ncbi:uncharacterized protein FRV6_01023 [Fusarium oxysporum]|uniref:NACHT domain-containing protein n=1 Tax=Fusarium oxysporum TaxID=5507 RepID=A0A2H3SKX0_FUSOX|nr:uncharacterized protein FRV6_01023 [Fusarium oxysporum]
MVAAAYAKDLLYEITPIVVEAQRSMASFLAETFDKIAKDTRVMKFRSDRQENQKLIDDIRINHSDSQNDIGIGYIYFKYNPKVVQNRPLVLASLLGQLIKTCGVVPDCMARLYEQYQNHETQLSPKEVKIGLRSVISLCHRVFIVFDALDEADGASIHDILFYLFELQDELKINVFATSRSGTEIGEHLERRRAQQLNISVHKIDLEKILNHHVSGLPAGVRKDPQLCNDTVNGISDTVDGMFLLAAIYMDSLKDKFSRNDITLELNRFRKENIASDGDRILQENSIKLLSWLSYAQRRHVLPELRDALATKVGDKSFDIKNILDIEDLLKACAGLVTCEADGSIQFAHYTTQEYFAKKRSHWFPTEGREIADVCATYLAFDSFHTGDCKTKGEFEERLSLFPFYDYSAESWCYHAASASVSDTAIGFLWQDKKCIASSQALIHVANDWTLTCAAKFPYRATGLHLATFCKLESVASHVLTESGCDPYPLDGNSATIATFRFGFL